MQIGRKWTIKGVNVDWSNSFLEGLKTWGIRARGSFLNQHSRDVTVIIGFQLTTATDLNHGNFSWHKRKIFHDYNLQFRFFLIHGNSTSHIAITTSRMMVAMTIMFQVVVASGIVVGSSWPLATGNDGQLVSNSDPFPVCPDHTKSWLGYCQLEVSRPTWDEKKKQKHPMDP